MIMILRVFMLFVSHLLDQDSALAKAAYLTGGKSISSFMHASLLQSQTQPVSQCVLFWNRLMSVSLLANT